MGRLGLVIFLFFSFWSVQAQRLIMTPQVVGANLEITFEIANTTGANFSMGPFDMPITFDTVGLDINNMSVVQGEFGEPTSTFYDSVQAVMITNTIMNVAVRPDYISNNPADDTDPEQIVEVNTTAHIATLVIPITDCKTDLMLDWVPDTDVLGGARLDWLGNDLDPIARNNIASPFPVSPQSLEVRVTTDDPNDCYTLRKAIEAANALPGPDTIIFSIPANSVITLDAELEITDDSTVIEFPAPGCVPGLTIRPSGVSNGFNINGVEGTVIRGFNIQGFVDGILINASRNNIIQCNYIGTNAAGTAAAGNNYGIHILNSTNNLIGDTTASGQSNVISGNNADGIFIQDDSPFNVIATNFIGTDYLGTTAVGNSGNGIYIDGAGANAIGGGAARVGNLISGNGENGVEISGSANNTLYHNFIGTDITGNAALFNIGNGVDVNSFSNNNFIGDSTNSRGNVISGNRGNGVTINLAQSNLVAGNVIGLGFDGLTVLPNNKGVYVTGGQSVDNIIGNSLSTGGGNLISANNAEGIHIEGASANEVFRNYVGLDTTTAAAPNGASNILLNQGATSNTVAFNGIAFAPVGSYGIEVRNGAITTGNLWLVNSIYSNGDEGINFSTGNEQNSISPPTISVDGLTFSGVARLGAQIQLFSDSANQGQVYLDTAMASPITGIWSKTFALSDLQAYIAAGRSFITAIQTDIGSLVSSEFSIAAEICLPPVADIQHPTDPDWTFCVGDTLDITSDFVAGATYTFYMESTNGAVINVTDSTASLVAADFASSPTTDNLIVEVEITPSGCIARDTVAVNLQNAPTANVNLPSPQDVCEGTTLTLSATSSTGSGIWDIIGDGTFDDPTLSNATYTPGTNDITNGSAKLYYTTTNMGLNCSAAADTLDINITPGPVLDVGIDQIICNGDNATLKSTGSDSNVLWSVVGGGDGTFQAPMGNTGDSVIYVPGTNDITNGLLRIQGAISGGVVCPVVVRDTLEITIINTIQVDAGPDTIVCSPVNVDLVATSFPGYEYIWTRQGGGLATAPTVDEDTINVTLTGKYYVETQTTDGGCYSIDSVTVIPSPTLVDPNVVFFNATSNSVTFAWDSVAGAVDYTLTIDTCRYPDLSSCTALPPVTFPNSGPFRYTQGSLAVGDSVNFTVVANDGCGSSTNPVTAYGSADSCNALFTGLNSDYCTASFLSQLYPEFDGGVFTASPVSGAVKYSGSFYYFDPAAAGPGDHWVYYENCGGSRDSAMTTVYPAPCVTDVVDDSTASAIDFPRGIYTSCSGEIYTSSAQINSIVKIDTFGVATIITGDSTTSGNTNGPVATALVNNPIGIVVMPDETIYFVNSGNHTVREISGGIVSTLAGSGSVGTGGGADDGIGIAARFVAPYGLALSKDLTKLYVTDEHRLRQIDLITLQVTTLAGTGSAGDAVGNGALTRFREPSHIVADANYVYITDRGNRKIKRYNINTGITEDFAYSGDFAFVQAEGFKDDVDSPAPRGISLDEGGGVFVADQFSCTINRIEDDTVSRFAGDYGDCDDIPGSALNARFNEPDGLSVFSRGFLDVADAGNNKIKRIAINDFLKNPLGNLDTVYCQTTELDTLASSVNTAGTYVGTGISNTGTHWVFEPSTVGTYNICYNYQVGYCDESLCFEVTVVPSPVIDLGGDQNVCSVGLGVDSLKIDSSGLATIDWRVNNVLDPGDDWFRLIDQAPAQYIVAVEDTNGCTAADTAYITLSQSFVEAGTPPTSLCEFISDTIDDATINGSTITPVGYTVSWSPAVGLNRTDTLHPIVNYSDTTLITYYLNVTDTAGCTDTDSIKYTIYPNPEVYAAVTTAISDTIFCYGNTLALTDTTAANTGGTYSWTPAASGVANPTWKTTDVLPTDTTTYYVEYIDSYGCSDRDSVTLYPIQLSTSISLSQDTACIGDVVTATATVLGSPYNRLSYDWENQGPTDQNTFTFPLSFARDSIISVSIVDTTSGCGQIIEADTLFANDLAIVFVEDSIDICNIDSAQIEATISGGLAPYITTWTGTAGDIIVWPADEDPKVQPITLGGSFFYVEVTDNGTSGCILNDSVYVNRKDPLSVQAAAVPAEDTIFCLGTSVDLTARAIPAGVGGTYSWRASDGTAIPSLQNVSVTPLDTITAYAQYTDAEGCLSTEDSVLLYPQELLPTLTFSKDTACVEEAITITAGQSSGIGPFVYSWDNGSNYATTNSIVVTPRADTTITVFVYDSASGCEEFIDSVLVVNDLALTFAQDSVGVCFDSLATVEAIVTGGSPTYTVTWTGPDYIASPGALVTQVGTTTSGSSVTYTATITDQLSCAVFDDVVVYMNTQVLAEAGRDTTICAGNPVNRTATASGGQASYTFGWTDGGSFSLVGASLSVSPTDTTKYYVGVEDVYGCPGVDSMTVNVVDPQIEVVTQINNFCPGTRDSVYINLLNPGSGNYTYSFDNGATFGSSSYVIMFPTRDTTIRAVLRDITGGCEVQASVFIDVEDFDIDLGPDKALCTGLLDPSTNTIGYKINSNLVGGSTPFASIVWNVTAASPPSSSAADVDITQTDILNPTIRPNTSTYTDEWFEYFITIEDAAGCIVSDTIRIYYPEPFITFVAQIGTGAMFTICDGQQQQLGYPVIPTEGGVQPYNITWDAPGTNVDGSTDDFPIFQSNGSGVYTFTKNVTDSIGCRPQYVGGMAGANQQAQVTVNDAPAISFEADGVAVAGSDSATYCQGSGFTLEDVAVNAGTVTRDWRYPNNTGGSISNTAVATDSREGWFFLRVDDVTCFRTDSIYMEEIPLATVTIDPVAGPVCDNEDIIVTATYAPSGGSFTWNSDGLGSISVLSSEEDSIAYSIDPSDASPITFDVIYNAGCNNATNTSAPVAYNVSPTAGLDFSSTSLLPTDTIMVMDTSVYPNGWASSEFYFENGIQNGVANENATGTGPFDVFEVRFDTPGTQNVCIKVTEGTGCSDSLCVGVNVIGSAVYYIPNVMSMQATNTENQVVKVYGPSLIADNFKFEVYNRWGELIYETDDFDYMNTIGWNGINQNTGAIEVNGVYTYRADLSFDGGATTQATGTITIVK